MAVTSVVLGPALRAWSLAGMTHILCDGPVDAVLSDAAQTRTQETQPLSATPLPASPQQMALDLARSKREASESGISQNQADKVSSLRSLALAMADSVPTDPKDWPFPWNERFAKSVRAPILWTYHELGDDLRGTGGSKRGAFLKSLIGDLRLPKGSSVFWPSAMSISNQDIQVRLEANPAIYAAGVRLLNPRIMVVLGDKSIADMGLAGRIKKFRQEIVEGRLLLFIPDIETLLTQPNQRQSAVSLLRAVLGSLNFF